MKRTIRDLRLARGLTQIELARQAQVAPSQLCRLERLEVGASPAVLARICEVLDCRPEDVLTAEVRKVGGQPKTAKEELRGLVIPPGMIARPRWTSACRLAGLRRDYPQFMRRMEPVVSRCSWFLEEAPSESVYETMLQLLELDRGALATHLSTADLGFDVWPVCDEDGRGGATCRRPALVTKEWAMLFQVSVVAGGRRPRMDTLILVRKPRPTFVNGEIDGEGHDFSQDARRTEALQMVTLRIPGPDLLKGPCLTERLKGIGLCGAR